MTEHARRRVDQLVAELIELVETARAVPMSGSCVLPREHTLDLLDDLHGSLPAELAQARQVLVQRDAVLAEARERAAQLVAEAEEHAARLVADAEVQAHETVQAGRAEHAELVSASRVHQAATAQAAQLHAHAEQSAAEQRAQAEQYAADLRAQAEHYAAGLRTDASSFADRTLADLIEVLQQATDTAEQGRASLAAGEDTPEAPADYE